MNKHSNTQIKKGIYILAINVIFFLTAMQTQAQNRQWSQELIDSLETTLNKSNASDDEIYTSCKRLSAAFIYRDTEKSLEYTWKGINLAKKRKQNFIIAEFYYNAGTAYSYLSRLDSSLYCYEQAIAMQELAKNKKEAYDQDDYDFLQLTLLIGIGALHFYDGKFDLSLDHWLKALDNAEKMDELNLAGTICVNLAENYASMMNFKQAEVFFLKAEKFFREVNNAIDIARVCSRLSEIYIRQEDYQKALEYAEESYNILSAMPNVDVYHKVYPIRSLATVWLNLNNYEKALKYALIAVEYSEQIKIPETQCTSLGILSKCYLKLKKYKEAEEAALKSLAIDYKDISVIVIIYRNITEAYIGLKNSEKALEYFNKVLEYTEIYSNQNFQSSISEMEVKYETEKKEMQIVSLKEKNRLMRMISISGGGVLFLGLVALFFLWRWTTQKKRLAEQQKQFAEQQLIQLEQEKQIIATQAVFDGEVQERTRLAHDLHDGMGGKLTAMRIHLEKLKQDTELENTKNEQYKVVMNILDDSVQEMRRVSHNLMPDTLSRAGLKPAVAEFCRSMSSQIDFKYYGEETRLDLKLEALVYRSIYELVNNTMKYASASEILVQITREPDCITFIVQDNGCGFDTSAETDGMGLQSIRARVASFGGNIQIDSKEGVGTEVYVELKIES